MTTLQVNISMISCFECLRSLQLLHFTCDENVKGQHSAHQLFSGKNVRIGFQVFSNTTDLFSVQKLSLSKCQVFTISQLQFTCESIFQSHRNLFAVIIPNQTVIDLSFEDGLYPCICMSQSIIFTLMLIQWQSIAKTGDFQGSLFPTASMRSK